MICAGGLFGLLFVFAGVGKAESTSLLWNQGWKFNLGDVEINADDSGWENVSLPHTPRIEQPMEAGHYFQGVCWYHKHFRADSGWTGKKILLRFDGAMQIAEVWLNGKSLAIHQGGYLPWVVNLTSGVNWKGDNVVAVLLDNRDQPDVPPGNASANLDFTYQGGLYRDVHLLAREPMHITDVFEANRVAGGGIFVRTESADATKAIIVVQADVQNDLPRAAAAEVRFRVLDTKGKIVAVTAMPEIISAGNNFAFSTKAVVLNPKLWHPDHPFLYRLITELRCYGKVMQTETTPFGIRMLAYDDRLGFVINGRPLTIRGANRHQDFPWLGNAVPDNAQYRDLKRLKDAGFNFLRLAHYPQSSAVMDACDELGLMVSVCTPGWQYFNKNETFTNLAGQNVREMVRWHRNHPSAIMWEVSLNETYGHDKFYAECARIAHEEFPGGQMFTSGDTYGSKDGRHFEVPYAVWVGGFGDNTNAPGYAGRRRTFVREYGDYAFGGEHSTTRIAIGDGEEKQLLQTWNFLWVHNLDLAQDWSIGDCIWVGVDHFRGCSENNSISRCGVLDYLRLPKFSYYFFQSQRGANAPSIFIANYWTPRPSPAKVVVFSNCEEIELLVKGKTVARQKPDSGPDSDYGVWHPEADPVYMASGKIVHEDEAATAKNMRRPADENFRAMFDGGNCRNVAHPPFTFAPVPFEAGELKAIGYVGGEKVCEFVRRTPGAPVALRLTVENMGRDLEADGSDAVFVRAVAVDKSGDIVPTAELVVRFSVQGAGKFVSPTRVITEAGAASMLLQAADKPGKIHIVATAAGMPAAKTVVYSRPAHFEAN